MAPGHEAGPEESQQLISISLSRISSDRGMSLVTSQGSQIWTEIKPVVDEALALAAAVHGDDAAGVGGDLRLTGGKGLHQFAVVSGK